MLHRCVEIDRPLQRLPSNHCAPTGCHGHDRRRAATPTTHRGVPARVHVWSARAQARVRRMAARPTSPTGCFPRPRRAPAGASRCGPALHATVLEYGAAWSSPHAMLMARPASGSASSPAVSSTPRRALDPACLIPPLRPSTSRCRSRSRACVLLARGGRPPPRMRDSRRPSRRCRRHTPPVAAHFVAALLVGGGFHVGGGPSSSLPSTNQQAERT